MPRSARRHSPTLKDIAQATGLSVSTVSRALAKNPVIPEETRIHVLAAAKQLKYRPNAQARALRNQQTNIIGIVVPDIAHPFFTSLVATIQKLAHQHGYTPLISNTDEQATQLENSIDFMWDHRVDGLIVVPQRDSHHAISVFAETTPVVTLDRAIPKSSIPAVISNPQPGIASALRSLAANNAPLGYLPGPQDTATAEARLKVVRSIASQENLDIAISVGGHDIAAGQHGAAKLIDQGARAILTGDTLMTFGAIHEIHRRGLRLAQDIALVGFDDSPMLSLLETPLSTIDQQVELIAQSTFEALESMIRSGKRCRNITIPTVFRERRSHSLQPGTA